jgi:hypothetical protein
MRKSTSSALLGTAITLKNAIVLANRLCNLASGINRLRVGSLNDAVRVRRLPHCLLLFQLTTLSELGRELGHFLRMSCAENVGDNEAVLTDPVEGRSALN